MKIGWIQKNRAGAGAAAKRGSRYAWGTGCAATGPGRGFSQGPGEKNGHPLFPRMDLLKTAVPLQPAGRFPDGRFPQADRPLFTEGRFPVRNDFIKEIHDGKSNLNYLRRDGKRSSKAA